MPNVCTYLCVYVKKIHLLSSSTIVTVAWLISPVVTLLGSDDGSMESWNLLASLNISSLFIITSNVAVVVPAENVAVYGPER